MINFHCTIIPVVVLDSVVTHTSAWFLDREIHQLVFGCFIEQVSSNILYIKIHILIDLLNKTSKIKLSSKISLHYYR